MVKVDVELQLGRVGPQGGLGVENPVPFGGWQEDHIVRRSLRCGLRRQADTLKEGIRVGHVDDTCDRHHCGIQPDPGDVDGVARSDMQVRRGLLRDQHTVKRA